MVEKVCADPNLSVDVKAQCDHFNANGAYTYGQCCALNDKMTCNVRDCLPGDGRCPFPEPSDGSYNCGNFGPCEPGQSCDQTACAALNPTPTMPEGYDVSDPTTWTPPPPPTPYTTYLAGDCTSSTTSLHYVSACDLCPGINVCGTFTDVVDLEYVKVTQSGWAIGGDVALIGCSGFTANSPVYRNPTTQRVYLAATFTFKNTNEAATYQ